MLFFCPSSGTQGTRNTVDYTLPTWLLLQFYELAEKTHCFGYASVQVTKVTMEMLRYHQEYPPWWMLRNPHGIQLYLCVIFSGNIFTDHNKYNENKIFSDVSNILPSLLFKECKLRISQVPKKIKTIIKSICYNIFNIYS